MAKTTTTTTVYAPNRDLTGVVAGVPFARGQGEVDEASHPGAMLYFRRAGYGIGTDAVRADPKPTPYQAPAPAEVRRPQSLDAAVQPDAGGPVSDAFLPPTNSGAANPHGPSVVSPGLHAVPPAPIRPGAVHVEDPQRQEREETELAQRVLVDGEPATIAAGIDESGDTSDASLQDAGVPRKNGTKAAWVDYAVSQGMDRDEADDMTRDQLQQQLAP